MKVLITGQTGFIGGNLAHRAISEQWDVRSVLSQRLDMIFHLAGKTRNQACIEDPVDAMQSNVMESAELFQYALDRLTPVVYTSSSVVYSSIRTPYQISKIAADSLAQFYNEHGGDIRILRLGDVYGPGMRNGPLAIWREQYRKNGVIDVWEGSAKRDYIYISDAVEALVQAVKLPAGVYDVCSGVQTELADFAGMLRVPMRTVPAQREVAKELPQVPHPAFTMKVSLPEGMAEVRKEFA